MTLPELDGFLTDRGIKLAVRLVVDAPRGVLTPEIKAALVTHRPALIARLIRNVPPPRGASWERLASLRWGPAVGDPTPGLIVDRSDPERLRAALAELENDPDAIAEREAIRVAESDS